MYSHLPEYINPVAFSIDSFQIRWYALMYLAGFLAVYFLLRYRIYRSEGAYSHKIIEDFILYAFTGVLIGGRIGYVLLYGLSYFWEHPWAAVYPFDLKTGEFIGIFGMSYFGGLAGVILSSWIFTKKNNINFWKISDFIVPAVPAGYFFGRVGNFLNGELYGKVTDKSWGMYFGGELRHPAQLYEAFLEGLLLFVILWALRNNKKWEGLLLPAYFIGYGAARLAGEFFRAPAEEAFVWLGGINLSQLLSVGIMLVGIIFIWQKYRVSRFPNRVV